MIRLLTFSFILKHSDILRDNNTYLFNQQNEMNHELKADDLEG